jgi:hypothetical protein
VCFLSPLAELIPQRMRDSEAMRAHSPFTSAATIPEGEALLVDALWESDPRIINGWLTAIASDVAEVEEMGLE